MENWRNNIKNSLSVLKGYKPLDTELINNYNNNRPYGPRKRLCYAPFSSMFINTLGKITPCYANYNEETYPEKSLKEIWFRKQFKKLRKKICHNDLSNGCEFCKTFIDNEKFESILAKKYDNMVFDTEEFPGINNKVYPKSIEFELSNSCDLECIMCDGNLSSAIRKNREKRHPLKNPYDEKFIKELEEFIPHLKVAEFTGGSPFLVNIYYDIWEMILTLNPECHILITTSANIMNDKIRKMINRGRFNLNISIDSLQKKKYESIRINANFENVMKNIQYFHAYCKEKNTSLTFLVCPLRQNWQEFPDFINFANDLGVTIYFHIVFKPYHLALWSLESSRLKEIYEELSKSDFPEDTPARKTNRHNYLNLVMLIKTWYDKAVIREKIEQRKEQDLQEKIKKAKNEFFENLRNHIHNQNGLLSEDKENKKTRLYSKMEKILNTLPEKAPPDIVFVELAKYKIKEVVAKLESAAVEEMSVKIKEIYDDLYAELRNGCYSIKYAHENEKYYLNMSYI